MPAVQGALIVPTWDNSPNSATRERPPHALVAVAPVADHQGGSVPRTARTGATHAPEVQERFHVKRLVPFTAREDKRHRLTSTFGTQVNLG